MPFGELRDAIERNGVAWSEFLSPEPDAEEIVKEVDENDGYERDASIGIRLAQALHHGTDHRSRICTALTTFGVQPHRSTSGTSASTPPVSPNSSLRSGVEAATTDRAGYAPGVTHRLLLDVSTSFCCTDRARPERGMEHRHRTRIRPSCHTDQASSLDLPEEDRCGSGDIARSSRRKDTDVLAVGKVRGRTRMVRRLRRRVHPVVPARAVPGSDQV
jgi:hypothetical protein